MDNSCPVCEHGKFYWNVEKMGYFCDNCFYEYPLRRRPPRWWHIEKVPTLKILKYAKDNSGITCFRSSGVNKQKRDLCAPVFKKNVRERAFDSPESGRTHK